MDASEAKETNKHLEIMVVLRYQLEGVVRSVSVPFDLMKKVACGSCPEEVLNEQQFASFRYERFIVESDGRWAPTDRLLFKTNPTAYIM